MDICGLQEVLWRGQHTYFIKFEERRYKLWWLGNDVGKGGIGNTGQEGAM